MQPGVNSRIIPQDKVAAVARKNAVLGVLDSQGTSRRLWDSVEIDGAQMFRFFQTQGRSFPRTNVAGGNGALLTSGEILAIKNYIFQYVVIDPVTDIVTVFDQISTTGSASWNNGFFSGKMDVFIENERVIKDFSTSVFNKDFNPNSEDSGSDIFNTDTIQIVLPLIGFEVVLTVPPYLTVGIVANSFIRCEIGGNGGLLKLKGTL